MKRSALVVLILVVAFVVVQFVRPVPPIKVKATLPITYQVPGTPPAISWPTGGQAALAVSGIGEIGHSGIQAPVPIASVAKIMTALIVLQKHPLAPGANGPTLTVTPSDYATYQQEVAQGDSVAKVAVGEQLTERQLLEALLLPSGDNIATMLAQWTAGSVPAFANLMNAEAKQLGLKQTTYTDPSGLAHTTVSTAQDQLKVAEAAMQIRAFRHIVRMPQATLPVAGTVYNVDAALGTDGVIGIKTGSTPHDGGSFAFAAYKTVNNQQVLIIGVVLNQGGVSSLNTALTEGETLIQDASHSITTVKVARVGMQAAQVSAPWTNPLTADMAKTVSFVGWPGMAVQLNVHHVPLGKTISAGSEVATVTVTAGTQSATIPLTVSQGITAPSYQWRLEHL